MNLSHRGRLLAGKLALSLASLLICMEVALRLIPACVPTKALVYFREDLRSRIAKGRFARLDDAVGLERDDGGPELRVWKPYFVKPYSLSDPGAVAAVPADEIGFSNPVGTYTRNAAVDIVTIGDSFTWAHAVNPSNTWSYELERLTHRRVLNLGKGGTGPYEYLQILKHFGLAKHPRIVVMNIYEGNDIRDALFYRDYRGSGATTATSQESFWKRIPVISGSYAYNVIGGSAEYALRRWKREQQEGRIDFRYWVPADDAAIAFNPQQGARDEVAYPRQVIAGLADFEVFDEALRAFADLGREHGFIPVLTYTPAACIVYAPVRYADPEIGVVLRAFSLRQRAYFAERTHQQGIVFLDLTEPLRAAAFPVDGHDLTKLLYYPGSLHYTARGHATVAAALAPVVQRLLP